MRRSVVLIFVCAVLGAVTASFAEDAEFTVVKDLAYGDHVRQVLDIYSPAAIGPDTPVIVYFHGGAWRYGTKAALPDWGKSFARAGMIFVAPNYRLSPDGRFPDFAEDAAAAVAYALNVLRTDAGGYRAAFLAGWSAGGYNAAIVAYDERLLAEHGIQKGTVSGLIGLSGPYEGGLCAGVRCAHIFPEELRADWTVAVHVDSDDPPMLLIAAEQDPYVPARHHEDLAEAARRVGLEAQVLVLPSNSHYASRNAVLDRDGEARTMIDQFIADQTAR